MISENNKKKYKDIYSRKPLCFRDGVPIFSKTNEYIKNYEKISHDQIAGMQKTGENPFISEKIWTQLENSTMELISKYSKRGDMVLDVGVGLGRLLSPCSSLNRYGMDISLEFLKIAKSKHIEVCYSLIEDMPYKENLFDLVVCTDVLEHVLDLNLVCYKILSTLKKGGLLIIRVPYREDLSPYFAHNYPYKLAHLRNFDEYSLILLFTKMLNCKFIEFDQGVRYVQSNKLKYIPKNFKIHKAFNILMHMTKYINKKLFLYLINIFYNPIEINIVFQKKNCTEYEKNN